jgi:tripartite ATP-independent transporter DctP family solute receptor
MKKLMTALLILLCFGGYVIFAAGSSEASNEGGKIIIKLSDQANEDNPHYAADIFFAEKVAEKTNGAVEVKVFPNSQLGNARETLEGTLTGTVEATKAAAGALTSFSPGFGVFSLPYVFTNKEQVFNALNGELGARLENQLEDTGFKVLAYYDTGFRSVFNKKRPINNLSDMSGLKIRVMNDPIMIDTFNSLGSLATPLAYSELYTGLKQGVVDGGEQPAVSLFTMKFFEVSDYFSLTNHFYDLNVVVMSKALFDSLEPNIQKALLEAGKETQEYERQVWQEFEDGVIAKIEGTGMKVNSLDLGPFKAAVDDVIDSNKDKIGADIVDIALSYSR